MEASLIETFNWIQKFWSNIVYMGLETWNLIHLCVGVKTKNGVHLGIHSLHPALLEILLSFMLALHDTISLSTRAPSKLGNYWDAQEISQGLREISRAEGVDLPIVPEFWSSTAILFITNPSLGSASGNPSLQGRIDSVKSNPSLYKMREWGI